MNILQLDGLVKTYETGHRALDHLTFAVPEGSIFGFIGLNGAGKTTTIRILAGLSKPDEGVVQVFGEDLMHGGSSYKRSVGFVLDEPLYFEWMSAGDYVRFVGIMYGLSDAESESRTKELLEFFDLTSKADDPIGTFSTGMKKKISLAAAIIHKPRLIVLDEPLEGIDALAARSIKDTLTLMAGRGSTIFITSHVLDTVEKFCTDVAIVHHGHIILQCRTSEIRKKAREALKNDTVDSLEELFVELVGDKAKTKHLSYL